MQIRLASHLHRNRCGIYGFRFVIPKLFRVYFPQNEYCFSLKTADKARAKHLSCRYSNLVQFCFERISKAMNFNEAKEHAKQLLQSIDDVNIGDLIEFARALAVTADDSVKKLFSTLENMNQRVQELGVVKGKLLKEFLSIIESASDEMIDAVVCDFYERVTPIKDEESTLLNQFQNFTLEIQSRSYEQQHSQELEAVYAKFNYEKEVISNFALQTIAKSTQVNSHSASQASSNHSSSVASETLLSAVIEAFFENQKK